MAVLKRQNVCFGTKYTDNAGQEKTRWATVGKAFHSDRGGISIKFDTIPAGGWDGWVQLFDERDPNQAPQGYSRQGAGPTGYGQQGPATAPQGYAGQPYPAAGQAPYGNQGTATRADSQYSGGYTVPPADNPDDLPF